MVAALPFTRADYDALPERFPAELVEGEFLKMPSPTMFHQELVLRIADALRAGAAPRTVVAGPVDFAIDAHNVLVPDVVALEAPPPLGARDITVALVVVEILAPLTAKRDGLMKSDMYLAAGVTEVWLVDPEALTIEVRRPREIRTFSGDEVAASRAVSGFQLIPSQLFAA